MSSRLSSGFADHRVPVSPRMQNFLKALDSVGFDSYINAQPPSLFFGTGDLACLNLRLALSKSGGDGGI